MNEFSLLCRVLGSLFYRQPDDPALQALWPMIHSGELRSQWPLEQDSLLERWQVAEDINLLTADYHRLFVEPCLVSPLASDWQASSEIQVRSFLSQRGMPLTEKPADHIGLILLGASWIEDHSAADENQAQLQLFDVYLLPWADHFLAKVNLHANTTFYQTLATITGGAIQAMYEELKHDAQGLALND